MPLSFVELCLYNNECCTTHSEPSFGRWCIFLKDFEEYIMMKVIDMIKASDSVFLCS